MRLWPLLVLVACSCATSTPRFEQSVSEAFAHEDMRHLVTPDVELYYPAAWRQASMRVASRATECLRALRAHQQTQRPHERALLFVTPINYNNAYVNGLAYGEPLHSLNPLFLTDEIFSFYGFSNADTGNIACHEMFHYAHFEQVENLWRVVNAITGPVMPPQAMMESWFTEGMAEYYEGRIGEQVGRPHSPFYTGSFEAFVASRQGALRTGDLSSWQRELSLFSGAYFTSLPFIEWLASTYGEDKLWQVMDSQGRSPFLVGVSLQFYGVYGVTLDGLFETWVTELEKKPRARVRPNDQQVLRANLGQYARLASHPASGSLALLTQGNEEGPRLRLLNRDGSVRAERTLTRLGTDRDWVQAGPGSMSGLSFSPDGAWLFLVNDDLTASGSTAGQIWKIDATTGAVVSVLQGVGTVLGGALHPDGRRYTVVSLGPGQAALTDVDLASGKRTEVLKMPFAVGVAAPAWAPAGERLVFSRMDEPGWNLVLLEKGETRDLTHDGAFNYGAHWVDEGHLVFMKIQAGRLQAHRLEVDTGRLEVLTDAPWTMFDVAPLGDSVAFLNREGINWSLDVAPMAAREVETQGEVDGGVNTVSPTGTAAREPLQVEQDEPYSSVDGLGIPLLRLPGVSFSPTLSNRQLQLAPTLFASLSGKDRLGLHNWALNASFTWPYELSSFTASYQNMQLAPVDLSVMVGRDALGAETVWGGSLGASRSVYSASVGASLDLAMHTLGPDVTRYLGPTLWVAYSAGEATAYGGAQRAFSTSLSGSVYPQVFGSSNTLGDLRASVTFAAPLPFSTRHSFVVQAVGRFLPGAPEASLQLGGTAHGTSLWTNGTDRPSPSGPQVFLPGSMVEAVRGYDDFAARATAATVGTARYRHNFIIDRGFASLFYVFPSIFFRQVDCEVFGSAALTNNASTPWLRAAGAAVYVRAAFGGSIATSLYYQVAHRFDLGLPALHVFGLAFE